MEVLSEEDPVRFSHPVVRLALASGLAPARRDELLRTAVRVLSRDGASPEQVGRHMLAVTPGGGNSIEPLRRAAGVARARGAPDLAVTFLRRALAEPRRRGAPAGAARARDGRGDDQLGVLRRASDGRTRCCRGLRRTPGVDAEPVQRTDDAGPGARGRCGGPSRARRRTRLHGRGARAARGPLCVTAFWVSDESPRARALLERFERTPARGEAARRLVLATRAAQFTLPAADNAALAREALGGDALITAPWIGNLLAIAALITCDDFGAASEVLERAMESAGSAETNARSETSSRFRPR